MVWQKKVFQSLQANLLFCVLTEDIKGHKPTLREESLGFVPGAFSLLGLWETDARLLKAGSQVLLA